MGGQVQKQAKTSNPINIAASTMRQDRAQPVFAGNRPEAIAQGRLQDMASKSPQAMQFAAQRQMIADSPRVQQLKALQDGIRNSPQLLAQRQAHAAMFDGDQPLQGKSAAQSAVQLQEMPAAKPNNTGLPDQLKMGVESLSGMSMDHVRVHYNSSQPAQLNAHAYAQGSDIHLAPGQEQHLPHEAWHVVQQAEGRVQPTMQLHSGVNVNDDHGLEREADAMGASALASRAGAPLQLMAASTRAPVVQMVKYIWAKGKVRQVPDEYKKKDKERLSTEDEFMRRNGDDADNPQVAEIRVRRENEALEKARVEREQARAARKLARATRRARVTPGQMPESHIGKQLKFPGVVKQADDQAADLVYRGMSVNNIRNLQKGKPAVFTAQSPTGAANAVEHIVDDSPESPYLSFEAGGLAVSAGKYAAKPVDDDNKPRGVHQNEDGFLKQEKSYTADSRRDYPGAKRIGYVGGIPADAGSGRLDVSTRDKAARGLSAPALGSAERREKARALAEADKEVLVKPGPTGIAPAKVPFVAKVQEVTEAYYRKHVARQSSRKALGFHKPYNAPAVYSKIQLPADNAQYKFNIPADLRRTDEDSEAEMSDIESMDLGDFDSDVD